MKLMIRLIYVLVVCVLFAQASNSAITWGNFYFDGIYTTTNGIVDATPQMVVTMNAPNLPSFNWIISVDGVVQPTTISNPSYSTPNLTYQFSTAMAVGVRQIVVTGHEGGTTNNTTINVTVQAASQQLVGSVAPYPSPATSNINFQYTLAETSDIVLSIFNISGQMIHQRKITGAAEGAHAGLNTINWDLASGFDGRRVANGVYIGILTSSGKTQPLGRFKFMVLN